MSSNLRGSNAMPRICHTTPRHMVRNSLISFQMVACLTNMSDAQSRPSLEFGAMDSQQYQPLSLTQEKHLPQYLMFDP